MDAGPASPSAGKNLIGRRLLLCLWLRGHCAWPAYLCEAVCPGCWRRAAVAYDSDSDVHQLRVCPSLWQTVTQSRYWAWLSTLLIFQLEQRQDELLWRYHATCPCHIHTHIHTHLHHDIDIHICSSLRLFSHSYCCWPFLSLCSSRQCLISKPQLRQKIPVIVILNEIRHASYMLSLSETVLKKLKYNTIARICRFAMVSVSIFHWGCWFDSVFFKWSA